MNTLMSIFAIFSGIGMVINDFVSIISVFGSSILLISAIFFPNASRRKLDDFFKWSIGGLFLGGVFQLCVFITGSVPEKIGVFLRLPVDVVNVLFVLSFVLLMIRLWVIKRRPPAAKSPSRRSKRSGNITHIHIGRDVHGSVIVGDENDTKQSSK